MRKIPLAPFAAPGYRVGLHDLERGGSSAAGQAATRSEQDFEAHRSERLVERRQLLAGLDRKHRSGPP